MKFNLPSLKLNILLIFIFVLITHLTYLNNGFTWLDHGDIEQNRAVLNITQIFNVFTERLGSTSFYRPIVTILHSLDFAIYKQYSPGYHFTNILLHTLAAVLVPFFISLFIPLTVTEILVTALIFSIHPYSILPAGQISYRSEILLLIFTSLTLISYNKIRTTNYKKYYLFFSFFMLSALMSKETALFLIPSLIILWELINLSIGYKKNKISNFSLKNKNIQFILILINLITFLFITLRYIAVPELWGTTIFPGDLNIQIGTRITVILKLLFNLFSPFIPSFSDAVILTKTTLPLVLIISIILAGYIFSLKKVGLKNNWNILAALLMILAAPALNIIPVPRMGSVHYGYILIIPFILLIILLFRDFKEKSIFKISFIFIILFWSFISLLTTIKAGFRFKNDETLFFAEVKKDKNFAEGNTYLGTYYINNKKYDLAIFYLTNALKIDKNYLAYNEPYTILTNLAGAYYGKKDYKTADKYLELTEKFASPQKKLILLYNRAVIASEQGNYKKTIMLLEETDFSTYPLGYLVLADAYHNVNEINKAVEILKLSKNFFTPDQQEKIEKMIESEMKRLQE